MLDKWWRVFVCVHDFRL